MYKWHVNSAIGRGRPLANDLAKVADGIAASLRQFSVSVSRTAEDREPKPPSRSQRSADALKEVSSLSPAPSRGIDARSLAAKPPAGFTVRRVDDTSGQGNGRGRGFVSRGGRGDFRGDFRGGMRGGAGGRGGMRGRGRGGRGAARGRGRGARGRRPRAPRQRQDEDDDFLVEPYTEEEAAQLTEIEGGYTMPYNPTTSMESLARYGPPVISSPRGLAESAIYKMAVATDNVQPDFKFGGEHLIRVSGATGTLFENAEQRAITQAFKDQKGKELAERMGVEYVPVELGSLSKTDKDAMTKQWIGGQYVRPKLAEKGDILGQVAAYARRNETYLPEDLKKLEEKLRELLPAQNLKPKPGIQKPL